MGACDRSDTELIDAIRRTGDPGCLEALVQRHTGRVRALVYPLVLNDADADDVTQEAMLRALAGLDGFAGRAAFTTWLHRVAVNTARNFLRSRNRRWAAQSDGDVPEDLPDPAGLTPARAMEADETDRAVSAAMAQLPVAQRLALSLVAMQRLPEEEAARVSGCTHATLRWRLFRARQRLRVILGERVQ